MHLNSPGNWHDAPVLGGRRALQEALLGFRNVNPTERSLGQGVGRNQGQTVHAHLVDAVDGLEGT